MNERLQSIAPRGPHGGMRLRRAGQVVSDDQLIDTWQLFRRTVGAVDGRLAAAPAAVDQLHSALTYETLAKLAASPNRMLPMHEIAAGVGASSATVTRMIDRLVKDGLVCREYSTRDRRVVYAVLTDKGVASERRSTAAYVRELRRDLESVGANNLAALTTICRQIQLAVADGRPTTLPGVDSDERATGSD